MDKNKRKEVLEYFKYISNCSISHCYRYDSGIIGENVLIVGAVHGNEKVGVETSLYFINKLKNGEIKLEKGSITFLIANPVAFLEDKRFIGKDLNRAFLEDITEDMFFEAKRVNEIRHFLKNNSFDVLIDLHSVSRGDFKILVYNFYNPKVSSFLEGIACLDLHFIYKDEHIPNTLMQEGLRNNIISFAIECGNHLSDNAFLVAKEQIFATLYKLKMINIIFEKKEIEIKKYLTIKKINIGRNFRFLVEDISTQTFLKKDTILSIDDDNGEQIISEDCYAFMPSKVINPNSEDAGFLCKLLE